MKGLAKNHPLLTRISKRLGRIRRTGIKGLKESVRNRKTIIKVGRKLDEWVRGGMHRENYDSLDAILDELELTSLELSYYCSNVLKKNFLTWRKELRINDAKELLLRYPDTPACHIGYAVGFSDKSNFRQQFKSLVGCTPTEWRDRHVNEYSGTEV